MTSGSSGGPPKVLVVDDDPDGLRGLAEALEGLQQNLVQARSGEEALRHVLKLDFAVIVVDLAMPSMDGLETASLVRQRKRSEQTPIIFLAGSREDVKSIFDHFAVGTVDYVMKPFAPEQLRSKVSMFVDLKRSGAAPDPQKAPRPGSPAEEADRDATVLDRTALLERVGRDAALLEELFILFRKDCKRIMGTARQAIDSSDAAGFGNAINALQGLFRNLSAPQASDAAARLQSVGLGGGRDQIQLAYVRLEREVRILTENLLSVISEAVQ